MRTAVLARLTCAEAASSRAKTATLSAPSAAQARMILSAISPRFATRTRLCAEYVRVAVPARWASRLVDAIIFG